MALGLIIGLAELGGAIAWSITTGELFTWSRATVFREQARAGGGGIASPGAVDGTDADAQQAEAQLRAVRHGAMVHPYLGFVHDGRNQGDPSLATSAFGFHGPSPIRKRGSDRYIVGILGGSVALMLGLYGEQGLRTSLERSPTLAGRRIEIVNLALGGYKQPQQLLALQLMLVLGGEFDCILNIDGFNEVALVNENVPLGVPGWFPRSWARLLDSQPSPEQLRRIGHIAVLAEERITRTHTADTLWWSPLAQFVWRWRDQDIAGRLSALRQAAERAPAADNPAITGPGTDGRTVQQASDDMVLLWQRASRQLHASCKQNGIRYFHFLQPNQYVPDSKPIGPIEQARAVDVDHVWRPFVINGFPKLRTAGAALKADGVAFTDLTRIFADHPEPLYTDTCCHFNRRGNMILADHIAAAVRSDLDLSAVQLQHIVASPDRLHLTSPITRAHANVIGIDAEGGHHDISGVGFGTRMTATPANNLQVAADGSIRATRRGDTALHIANKGMTTTMQITATWPDIFEADDAMTTDDHEPPRILFDADEVARGAQSLTVACSNLPAAPLRLLATSPQPLPPSPIGVATLGLNLTPIAAEGTTARVLVAAAMPTGQPLYVRFYALDESLTNVTSASNTIVITRD